jgi:hypothetical protein
MVDEQGYESASALISMSKLSRHFSLDFLTREVDTTKTRWGTVFPWPTSNKDVTAQNVHDEIFGSQSGVSLTATIGQLCCPWCSEAHRQREEFKAEMRILARLR